MEKSDKIINNLATNLSLKLGESEIKIAVLTTELQDANETIKKLQAQLEQKNEEE